MSVDLRIADYIQRHAEQNAGKIAIRVAQGENLQGEVTFGELASEATRIAGCIKTLIGEQRYVPVLANRSCASVAVMLGASVANLPFCCPSLKLGPQQMQSILRDLQATKLFVDAPGVMILGRMMSGDVDLGIEEIVLIDSVGMSPFHKKTCERMVASGVRIVALGDVCIDETKESNRSTPIATVLFTSGSTGKPKGVLIAESDLIGRSPRGGPRIPDWS